MSFKAALFDLDGVILDTEGLYTRFWKEQGKLFHPGAEDFSARIKGHTLKEILAEYFPDPSRAREIVAEIGKFERQMPFRYIPGAEGFIRCLKERGIKLAIVTSSDNAKMSHVYRACPELKTMFDRIVTADKITCSKPDPECYLLAAEELGVKEEECVVFEDSFSGLEAGRRAGMTVVGLATTNPAVQIRDKADIVIPDFTRCAEVWEKVMEKWKGEAEE